MKKISEFRSLWIFILLFAILPAGADQNLAWDAKAPAHRVVYSEADKAAQRQAGEAATKEMYAALDVGKDHYTFKPGVYRFTSHKSFDFWKKKNFSVHAAGCNFIMENMNCGLFLIQACSNMSIIGPLTIDSDPLLFSQAKIVSINETAKTVDFEIMPGYPAPPPKERIMVFDAEGIWQSPSPDGHWPFLAYSDFQWLDETSRKGRISVDLGPVKPIESLMKVGNYVTLGGGHGIGTLREVDGMTFQDVTVHTGCHGLIAWGGGSGEWNYTRVKAIPAPGTSRLIGGSGPQHRFGGGSKVVFDSCEFVGSSDDNLNVGGGSHGMLYKQESPRSILVMIGTYKVGDEVRIFEKNTYTEKVRAKIQAIEPLEDETLKEDARTVRRALLDRRDPGPFDLYRLTLESDVVSEPGAVVENLSARGESFVMRNCKWTNSTVRVMVQGFKKGLIEGNTFTRIGQGLAVTMDAWWWEGGSWDECIIRNNTFTQTPYVTYWDSAAIHYGPGIPLDVVGSVFGSVKVSGNKILVGAGDTIRINHTTKQILQNNTILRSGNGAENK